MTLDARRQHALNTEQHAHRPVGTGIHRRRRCPIAAGASQSFTTSLLPETRSMLRSVHHDMFVQNSDVDIVIPTWMLVECAVHSALLDPEHLADLVRRRIEILSLALGEQP